jgi:hypothetical protein
MEYSELNGGRIDWLDTAGIVGVAMKDIRRGDCAIVNLKSSCRSIAVMVKRRIALTSIPQPRTRNGVSAIDEAS